MADLEEKLKELIQSFSAEALENFLYEKNLGGEREDFSYYEDYNDFQEYFSNTEKLGEIETDNKRDKIFVIVSQSKKELSERSSRKRQYEFARKILKEQNLEAVVFVFYDERGSFRFSLIHTQYAGTKRTFNNFRRYTYFVSRDQTNKTFIKQIGEANFNSLESIKEAFSIVAVTDIFYKEFFQTYNNLVQATKEINTVNDNNKVRDFILLFVIRTIFVGFIQKRKWIGNDEKFLQNFLAEYENKFWGKNKFYSQWLAPLFFEALNSSLGNKVAYQNNNFSKQTETALQMAPYLNGGLFKEKIGYDDNGWIIPDQEIKEFFDFIFAHSFTIEESSLDDEDLQLNPEFLGIIFERLVNKADGAVYTPRTEVDFMCRLSLIEWLQKNLENKTRADNLYELFFKEGEKEEDQKEGSFSQREAEEILDKLGNIVICDPAAGSGAFLVGMMQVIDNVEQTLKKKIKLKENNLFERKKQIIKNSLYGVEVKEWAVWVARLRLWLSLFVDAPDELRNSLEPILPNLDFKIRQGDSLVQKIGSKTFPVKGHTETLSRSLKTKITKLKQFKKDYFENKVPTLNKDYNLPEQMELAVYEEILQAEIRDKESELRKLKNIKPTQSINLFGENKTIQQTDLGINEKEIDVLEKEIEVLKEQKQFLRKTNKPLIWNVEFAEVFSEKKGFDIIIGNPPYVRQEKIEDPTGKIKDKKEYKKCLQEMVRIDFPNDFSAKTKINAQSDLYTYFYIRGLRLLNKNGVHTFICSNSWLDVGYGAWLQNFLLKRCPIKYIIDNHAQRSFGVADVNTIISIIHAPKQIVANDNLVKFVAFKMPFEKSVYTENLLAMEKATKTESNEVLRVYPVANQKLIEEGSEYENEGQKKMGAGKYVGGKWGGKYLRAPDIFFTILEKGKDKLVKLGDVAEVRRGFTTGANEFFYLMDITDNVQE